MPERPSQDPRYGRLPDDEERRIRTLLTIEQTHIGDFRREEP